MPAFSGMLQRCASVRVLIIWFCWGTAAFLICYSSPRPAEGFHLTFVNPPTSQQKFEAETTPICGAGTAVLAAILVCGFMGFMRMQWESALRTTGMRGIIELITFTCL